MQVTEEQRRALFDRLREQLGEETATLLLEVTVPANIALATRGDIQELRAEMLLRFTELDGRLTGQITELDGRLTGRISDLDRRVSDLDRRLSSQMSELDRRLTELGRDLTGKLYTRVIPAIAVMLGVSTWFNLVAG